MPSQDITPIEKAITELNQEWQEFFRKDRLKTLMKGMRLERSVHDFFQRLRFTDLHYHATEKGTIDQSFVVEHYMVDLVSRIDGEDVQLRIQSVDSTFGVREHPWSVVTCDLPEVMYNMHVDGEAWVSGDSIAEHLPCVRMPMEESIQGFLVEFDLQGRLERRAGEIFAYLDAPYEERMRKALEGAVVKSVKKLANGYTVQLENGLWFQTHERQVVFPKENE